MNRSASIARKTKETDIEINLCADGSGKFTIETGIAFFDHMLSSFAMHGGFDITGHVKGDLEVDQHHTVEDTGIVLGQVFAQIFSQNKNVKRFGSFFVPMDEALSFAAVDISGRPYLVYDCHIGDSKTGDMDSELFLEFFRAFTINAGLTLHTKMIYGSNGHHMIEALFKAVARAIREALTPNTGDVLPSTKGLL
ncbi:MAG: imidazoleglycerol-phosphate dehydratase HisB [Bacillota bacterium]|nr:imidazoleglycerol-phosphate dehydratase HisB [Bacillota bacterium]